MKNDLRNKNLIFEVENNYWKGLLYKNQKKFIFTIPFFNKNLLFFPSVSENNIVTPSFHHFFIFLQSFGFFVDDYIILSDRFASSVFEILDLRSFIFLLDIIFNFFFLCFLAPILRIYFSGTYPCWSPLFAAYHPDWNTPRINISSPFSNIKKKHRNLSVF